MHETLQMKNLLASRNSGVEWSGIRIMFALAEDVPDVINLGIGQPDFDTPLHIRDAAKKALDEGYTRYPPANGFADLRQAIANKLRQQNGIMADPETEIFVAVGAMQVVFNTMLQLVEPGDEVIVADPGYDYYSQIRLFGGVPRRVPVLETNRFRIDPDDLNRVITNKTKLIVINSPGNPTGAVLDSETLAAIAQLARYHGIAVLSDEPYEHIVFDGRKHISLASLDGMKELTISAYTMSKSYAMTGWRVGYVAAPKPIVEESEKLMEHMVSGVTSVSQRAALAAITGPQDCVAEMVRQYEVRREIVYNGLNEIDGVSCLLPEGAFYAFPNVSSFGMSSWDVAKYLVQEHRVAIIPGTVFGHNGEGYLRVSFAASPELLREGIARMKRGFNALSSGKTKVAAVPTPA